MYEARVPMTGARLFTSDTGGRAGARVVVAADGVEGGELQRPVSPGLYRRFAALSGAPEAVLAFAGEWGLLTGGVSCAAPPDAEGHQCLLRTERLDTWWRAIAEMTLAREVAQAVTRGPAGLHWLEERLRWCPDGSARLFLQFGRQTQRQRREFYRWHPDSMLLPPDVQPPLPLGPVPAPVHAFWRILCVPFAPHGAAWQRRFSLTALARIFLAGYVSAHLRVYPVTPVLTLTTAGAYIVTLTASCLLAELWWQFAEDLRRAPHTAACIVCGAEFPCARPARRQYCSNPCAQRAQRLRASEQDRDC
jgi:hypothetical protein